MPGKLRIGLTGSPTNNSEEELKQLLSILSTKDNLQPILDNLGTFVRRRLRTDTYHGHQLVEDLPGDFI
jgi:hypothetical protein